MPYPIEEKLVIAVASSALFALDEADAVFRKEGVRAHRQYQREHESDVLTPGIAFPFVRRFLELNTIFPERQPAERKAGCAYVTVTGRVRHVSVPEQTLVMEDGTEIPMEDVVSITGGISSPI